MTRRPCTLQLFHFIWVKIKEIENSSRSKNSVFSFVSCWPVIQKGVFECYLQEETQHNHCLSIGCFQHFVLDLSRTEISLLSVSFYLSSKLCISLLTSVFHWTHWGLMACFNVRSTSCRITHMLKCCYWSWGSTTLPFSLEHCGSVTSMDATICSQDASHMWTPSAQVIAFWHFVNLYSSQCQSTPRGYHPEGKAPSPETIVSLKAVLKSTYFGLYYLSVALQQ